MRDFELLLREAKETGDLTTEGPLLDAWEEAGCPVFLPWRKWWSGHRDYGGDNDVMRKPKEGLGLVCGEWPEYDAKGILRYWYWTTYSWLGASGEAHNQEEARRAVEREVVRAARNGRIQIVEVLHANARYKERATAKGYEIA